MADNLTLAADSEHVYRKALAQPWWHLRFDDELEKSFDKRIAPGQAKDARNNYYLALFFCNVFAFADYRFLPDVYQIAWLLRFGVVTPVFLVVIWAEFYSKQAVRRGVATMLLMLVTTAALMFPVIITKSPDVVHYHVGLIVVVLFSNLLTDLRFALALAASAVFSIMYFLELVFGLRLPGYLIANYAMIMLSAVSLSLVATYRRERHMRIVFLMLALLDIAERRLIEANAALLKLATLDPLTGLANRRRFDDEYPRLWKEATRHSKPLSVLFVDLDYFKSYNDTYGHAKGDEVLQRFAAILLESTTRRPLDLAVRNGGEEFLVLLPETPLEAATEIAQRLIARLFDLSIANERSSVGVLTASVGVVGGIPQPGQTPQSYIEQADSLMYKAKKGGRNRVEFLTA